jgi:hypothetical protein
MNEREALQLFRDVFPGSRVYATEEQAMEALEMEEPYIPIACCYKGAKRQVHPEACKWHQEENDPQCQGCKPQEYRPGRHKTAERPSWDPYNLPPGEYVPDGKGGWKLVKRYRDWNAIRRTGGFRNYGNASF